MQHRLLVLTLLVYCSFVVFTQTNPNSLPTRKAIIGWGQNNNGKLDNTRGILTMPTIIDNGGAYNLDDVVSVANGEYHMLVLLSNGDIFGRGGNSYGQLGNSSSYQQNAYNVKVNSTAFTVTGVTITDIAVCSYQSFAFAAAQNKLFEWGYKITGDVLSPQLIIFTPSQALYQKTIAKMFAGYFHAFVIDTDGKLYGRGAGYMDLLYPNAPGRQDDFVSVQPTLPPLKQVAVGMKHILVLGVNGKVYAWGLNDNGQIANAEIRSPGPTVTTPTEALFDSGVIITSIAAGTEHSMALSSDGSVYTWGNNNSGELGRNLVTFSNSTGKITDGIIYNVTKAISCGTATTFLQGVNNVLYGCGDGGYLGNGVNGIVNPCLAIVSDELSGVEIISMATSNYDTIVLVDKGLAPSPTLPEVSYSLIGWGVNNFAKIHANFLQVFAPAAIDMGSIDMSNVVSIANGQNHMLVLLQNGEIYGRGYHLDGQLGDGKAPAIYDYVSINVQVDTTAFTAAGAHITAIAAGSSASLALDSVNNKLFVWGYEYEQGTQILSPQLVQVNSSSPLYGKTITKIFAGYYNSFITDSDGKIYGIGINDEDSSTPVQLLSPAVGAKSDFVAVQPSLSSISQVAVGKYHVLALDTNGKVYGWGLNDYGQIADHIMDNTVRTNPIEIVFEANATIIAISAGGTHSVALSSTGAIYTWGDNIGGQLGRGDSSLLSSNVPTLTGGEMGSIKYITTGEYVTIVVTQDNSIYGCGDGISIGNGDYNVHYTFEKIVSSALEGNTPLLVTTGGPDTIVYAVTSVSTTTVLPTTTVEPTTPEPTFSPTTMAPTTVEPTITPTIAPTSTAATTQTPTTLQSCNNFDTNRYGAKKPIVSASTNGSSVTIVVTMYRQTMSNTGTPIYHAIDTKDTPTVCRTNSDNIQLSSSKPWSRSDDGCTTTYTLTQSLSEIVATNNTNNNWVAKLADDGRSITYTIRVYSTYSVNNAGSCYYVGYQSTISMRTVLSVASSSVEYTTEDNSARFLFNGLRITATQRLEIAGIIVPLIFNSELRNIYMRKSFDNITIPATTATCNAVNTGCYEIFSIDVSSLGGAGTDISDEYRIIMDVFKDGDRIISNATISFYISYSIPGDPIVVDSDTITTSIKLYTDNTYSVVRTASYASADGVLFVENKVTLSSPVIPSSHRLRMAEGYLCCVNYLSNIAPYNPVTGTGGCKDANGKMEQFSFGSETNHNTGVTVVSADASSPKRYRVQVELSKAYASIVHSVPMTCEVLLISKLESNARSITAAANLGGSFVATIPFSVQATQATTTPTVTPTTATTTATPVSTQKVAETIPAPSKSDARMNSISALLTIMALVFACYEIFSCQ